MADVETLLNAVGTPIIVATHPRSGTHLTIDLLRKQFAECKGWLKFGETLHHLYTNLDRLSPTTSPPLSLEQAVELLGRPPRPLCKTHARPQLEQFEGRSRALVKAVLEQGDLLYIMRDGRSVICSAHIWMQEYHPEARCSLAEFMRQRDEDGISRVKRWAQHVKAWTALPDVRVFKFEEIVRDPQHTTTALSKVLHLEPLHVEPYLPEKIKHGSRWADYWRRLTRQRESTAILGRYNGREPLDWRTTFTPADRRFFHEEAGEVLMRFGYEEDSAWTRRTAD